MATYVNRKDIQGRVLHKGEYQKKDGKYEYRYTDAQGVLQSVYSWKLNANDRIPNGKRECLSLREKENQIKRELIYADIHSYGDDTAMWD